MYRLLIVDDEEFEREGMAEFIPWQDYDVEMVGTAWNGVDGFEKIGKLLPDIVLTDIKMPVMNGIELIRKTKEIYPDIEFIVLSGYGEYEFTSQAMEEGIRHYILKPCDEDKIAEVIEKVKKIIEEKRRQKEETSRYSTTIQKLLPRAREQVFLNMLLGREQIQADYRLFLHELEPENDTCRLLILGFEENNDYLEQFISGNILGELLGENNVVLSAAVDKRICFLIREKNIEKIEEAVSKTRQEFMRTGNKSVYAAVSKEGGIEKIREQYLQVEELLRISELEKWKGLLCYENIKEGKGDALRLVDYNALHNAKALEEILFEVYLLFCKMQYEQYAIGQKREVCGWILKVLEDDNTVVLPEELRDNEELFRYLALWIVEKKGTAKQGDKEMLRFQNILMEIFLHLSSQELSIRYLAKEILFMNEDYFGRLFSKHQNVKFSAFVLEQRISIAKRMMEYSSDIKIGQVVELIGFPEDGQYFSKVFKKTVGISPSEYREKLEK
ncbi:MAG: response regulator [Lachnospiraceae bacterium]|nr:response regulator [Lachnospiraceae bacterium]